MAQFIITTRSTVYAIYEVEADTEQQAREIMDNQYGLEPMNEWSEDTTIYDVEEETEEEEE
jgi:hypothetical protein